MQEVNHWHILGDDGEPDWAHPVDSETFLRWLSIHAAEADIGRAELRTPSGATVEVSTRYFGWCATTDVTTGHPHVWETMIFGGVGAGYQCRYSTRRAAREGHARALELVGLYRQPCHNCLGRGQLYMLAESDILPRIIWQARSVDDVAAMMKVHLTTCAVCNGSGWLAADAPGAGETTP